MTIRVAFVSIHYPVQYSVSVKTLFRAVER